MEFRRGIVPVVHVRHFFRTVSMNSAKSPVKCCEISLKIYLVISVWKIFYDFLKGGLIKAEKSKWWLRLDILYL
jgi:hypothetical protein